MGGPSDRTVAGHKTAGRSTILFWKPPPDNLPRWLLVRPTGTEGTHAVLRTEIGGAEVAENPGAAVSFDTFAALNPGKGSTFMATFEPANWLIRLWRIRSGREKCMAAFGFLVAVLSGVTVLIAGLHDTKVPRVLVIIVGVLALVSALVKLNYDLTHVEG